MAITSYKELQEFITDVMEKNKVKDAPPPKSPHKAFWNDLSYEEFTNGFVPGLKDPFTGSPIKILNVGNSAESNLILALSGQGILFDDKTGAFGRMPANGQTPFTANEINEIAHWIDQGCPE